MDARKAHKASSSSSPSSSSKRWEYHIFLSFRGEDTRNGFTSHLHKALESKGYDVFMDEDDLQVGQVIKPELLQAIEKSKISVIVFSTRYADSSWCLDELVKIMECRRTLNQIVLPIFYKVDPSDVRKQTGTLASDFQKHTIRHKDEVVKEWKKALTEASNLCAGVLKDTADRNDAKFIEEFIENNIIGRLSTSPLPVAAYPVGVDSRVHDMINYLLGGGSEDVVMIGIWGMAGIGKTTAAKAIYNRIKDKFEAHGFLGDIGDTANRHGLVYLQKLLLAEINKKPTKFHISCVDGGMGMIKKELGRKRVLIIIDDVDDKEQLEAIVGNRDWFGSESRIIITTRDKHFLDVLHVNKTFTVPEMNPDEGLELFRRHAFEKGCPNERYLELSKKVVFYSGGLPLALKVLGSFLIGRTIAEWESQLEELEKIPPKDILKKLRISYDSLDRNEKCIFLDISCFFIGMNKDDVRIILDGCGFKAEIKISVLLQKCLVTVNEKNQLMMHDLLRDMGRAICQEGDPEDLSRLWLCPEDVTDVLEDKSRTKKVEGLALNLRSSEKASFSTEAFSKMRKLKLLQLNYVELTGEYKFLPKNLRWLCWHGFLLDSIPGDFDLTSLIAMDLQFSKLKVVWKDCKVAEKLVLLNLYGCSNLTTIPDLSGNRALEKLNLERCSKLTKLHASIGNLHTLVHLNLRDCENLIELPNDVSGLTKLENLILSGCLQLKELPSNMDSMVSLKELLLDGTSITDLPHEIGALKSLEKLEMRRCRFLRSLPESIGSMKALTTIVITGADITALPESIGMLENLTMLELNRCKHLRKLPTSIGQLKSLHGLLMVGTAVTELPESFGMLSRLKVLNMNKYQKREDTEVIKFILPTSFSNLSLLYELHAGACNISGKIADDFEKLSSLEILNLGRNNFYSLRGLSLLRKLILSHCKKLKALPPLPSSLEEVDAANCTSLESISDISNLQNLVMLNLVSCEKVVDIPGLECLKALERLYASGCTACSSAIKKRLAKSYTRKIHNLSIPGSKIPDWFSQDVVTFSETKNRVLKSVIIGVVVSLNQQIPDDLRDQLPAVVDILAQILVLDLPLFTTALMLLGVPNTNEDQVHLCQYPIEHPLVSQLKDGYNILVRQREPPLMKGVELKKWGIHLVYEGDDEYEGDEESVNESQQSLSEKMARFYSSFEEGG